MPAASQPDFEGRLALAINSLEKKQITSLRKAAATFEVPKETLRRRLHGVPPQRNIRPTTRKLTTAEDTTIIRHILDLDAQGFPQIYKNRRTTSCSTDTAFDRLIKGCNVAIQTVAILQAETQELRAANARKARKQ